jgi:hypothetical protein
VRFQCKRPNSGICLSPDQAARRSSQGSQTVVQFDVIKAPVADATARPTQSGSGRIASGVDVNTFMSASEVHRVRGSDSGFSGASRERPAMPPLLKAADAAASIACIKTR